MALRRRSRLPTPAIGAGLIGTYHRASDGSLSFEGKRPGLGWHRHDWKPLTLHFAHDGGFRDVVIHRRRWRLHGTNQTHLDRSPDEVCGLRFAVLFIVLKLSSWLLSGKGLHTYDERFPCLEGAGALRTVQRWLHRLLPAAARLAGALRTAVIERSEPQPIERLFPGGLSPPEAIRRRRWKDSDATYRLATGLAFLVEGAVALSISATALLAEAQQGLNGTLGTLRI